MTHEYNETIISKLTPNEKVILDFINNNIDLVSHSTLEEISNELFVSSASIVRFCQKLGFSGFNEFKYTLKHRPGSSSNSDTAIYHQAAKLNDFIESVDIDTIEQIADEIAQHKYVYIYGRNYSSLPARYLYSMLFTMDIECVIVEWKDFLKSLSQTISEDSVLIMFTNLAQVSEYKFIMDNLKRRNVKVIWISSSKINPILLNSKDIFINLDEKRIDEINVRTKMTSFILTQLIVECLLVKKCRKQ